MSMKEHEMAKQKNMTAAVMELSRMPPNLNLFSSMVKLENLKINCISQKISVSFSFFLNTKFPMWRSPCGTQSCRCGGSCRTPEKKPNKQNNIFSICVYKIWGETKLKKWEPFFGFLLWWYIETSPKRANKNSISILSPWVHLLLRLVKLYLGKNPHFLAFLCANFFFM